MNRCYQLFLFYFLWWIFFSSYLDSQWFEQVYDNIFLNSYIQGKCLILYRTVPYTCKTDIISILTITVDCLSFTIYSAFLQSPFQEAVNLYYMLQLIIYSIFKLANNLLYCRNMLRIEVGKTIYTQTSLTFKALRV